MGNSCRKYLLNNCFFGFYGFIGLVNAQALWLSGLGDWGPVPWVAALEVRALDVWTTSFQGEDGDLVLLLKQEGGRRQRHGPGSLKFPGGSHSATRCRLMSSWESTQWNSSQGRTGRQALMSVPSMQSPRGWLWRALDCSFINCFIVCYSPEGLEWSLHRLSEQQDWGPYLVWHP